MKNGLRQRNHSQKSALFEQYYHKWDKFKFLITTLNVWFPFRRIEVNNVIHCFCLQILASTAKNILLLDLGLALCFSTIVIPALTGDDKEHNPDEILRITPEQASWLGRSI